MNRQLEQVAWNELTQKQKRGIMSVKEYADIRDGVVYDADGNVKDKVDIVLNITEGQRKALVAIDDLSAHEIENGQFVFALYESCKTMEERYTSFNQADLARLMLLGTYTGYRTGRLQHDNNRVINKKGLEKIIGISRNKFNEFYKKLIDEGIIQEAD
jgi:hypothetical protein